MDVFLEAARLLELREAEFVIGGIGGGFPGFEKSVRARANELNVAILETEGRGLEFLESLDIVVMPSRWEGSPLTLFEAMALQKPIVATDIPGISEVLRGTGAGLLVRPDHADDLARAIARLIDDPGHEGRPTEMNVYDAAMLSCIAPLSEWSVANRSRPVDVPDFTRGRWAQWPRLEFLTA
jgi:glycosyltransferase involved in cell wall biosynthesis